MSFCGFSILPKTNPVMTNTINNPIPPLHVPIHITAHHVDFSEALQEFIENKIGALARLSRDVLGIDVVLRRTSDRANERFAASVRLAMPGRDIHSSAAAQDLYVAIGLAGTKLARHLRKRKTRLSKTYRARAEARRVRTGRNTGARVMALPTRSWGEESPRLLTHEAIHL
jgi:putative sigma-54 modulation protein